MRLPVKAEILSLKKEDRTKKIKTAENWCGTFDDGTVEVYFSRQHSGGFGVSVWGNDDMGMSQEFPSVDRQKAKRLYERITDYTTQDQLAAWGMEFC